jgi:hypothetical protein
MWFSIILVYQRVLALKIRGNHVRPGLIRGNSSVFWSNPCPFRWFTWLEKNNVDEVFASEVGRTLSPREYACTKQNCLKIYKLWLDSTHLRFCQGIVRKSCIGEFGEGRLRFSHNSSLKSTQPLAPTFMVVN